MEYIVYFLVIVMNLPFALNGNVLNILVIGYILGLASASIINNIVRKTYR